jgi:hypothetical protein
MKSFLQPKALQGRVYQFKLPIHERPAHGHWLKLTSYAYGIWTNKLKSLFTSYRDSDRRDAKLMQHLAKQRRSNNIQKRLVFAGYSDCFENREQHDKAILA